MSVLALFLIIIGALNWGLWGFFQFDLVAWLAKGNTNWMARFIYAIIGLAGVWSLRLLGMCKTICCGSCKGCGCNEKECKCAEKNKGICKVCGRTDQECTCTGKNKAGGGCCRM